MMQPKSLKIAVLAALAIFALSATIAVADTTRDQYVAAVEPICKASSDANTRALKGAKRLITHNKPKQAAPKFKKAATLSFKYKKQLAAVPQPAADANDLAKWLGHLKAEATLLNKIGNELKAGKKNKASIDIVNLQHEANLANNAVLSFGFHYCKQNPSKYT